MTNYYSSKEGVVMCAARAINHLEENSVLTITIKPGKSEGFSVTTVITESSEGIPMGTSSSKQEST